MNIPLVAITVSLALAQAGATKNQEKLPARAIARLGTLSYSHSTMVHSVDFASDGRTLFSLANGGFHFWEIDTGADREPFRIDDKLDPSRRSLINVVFARPFDKTIVGCTSRGYFQWDVPRGKLIFENDDGRGERVGKGAVSCNGKFLCTSLTFGTVRVHSVEDRKQVGKTFKIEDLGELAVSPDGKRLVSSEFLAGKMIAWDTMTGGKIAQDSSHSEKITALVFSPDGKTVYSTGDTTLRSWNMDKTSARVLVSLGEYRWLTALGLSRDGKLLAAGENDGTIHVWDVATWEKKTRFSGHKGAIKTLAFSGDGKKLASGSVDHTACIWDIAAEKLLTPRTGHRTSVAGVAFTPDAKRVITSAAFDSRLLNWAQDGSRRELENAFRETNRFSLMERHGSLLVTVGHFDEIDLWRLPDLEKTRTIKSKAQGINAIALSSDGRTISAGGWRHGSGFLPPKNLLRTFNTASGEQIKELEIPRVTFYQIRFSPEGKNILLMAHVHKEPDRPLGVGGKATVILKDLNNGKDIFSVEMKQHWSVFDRLLAYGKSSKEFLMNDGKYICLWDSETGRKIRHIDCKTVLGASAIAVGPRSGVLAIGTNYDRPVIEIWRPDGQKKLHEFDRGHIGEIKCLAFSDDESLLVSGSDDTTAVIWDFRGIVK
jgi:WD40 repeat protein